MIAFPIYFSLALGVSGAIYGAYLVWYRRKAEKAFHEKLYESFKDYYTDEDLIQIAGQIKAQRLDVLTYNKLREFFIKTLNELSPRERAAIYNALYQPSIKGQESYILRAATGLLTH